VTDRLPVALVGACGRMGRATELQLSAAPDFSLAVRIDPSLPADPGPPRSAPNLDAIDQGEIGGIIDFSAAAGTVAAARAALRIECPLVSGTTAVDDAGREALRAAAEQVPVCWAPNFSMGIPLLLAALREAAVRLPGGWHLEIAETHHVGKRDAPSGTALRLAETWREVRGGRLVHGRQGIVGPRGADEIGIHALRAGDVVGEHRVLLAGSGEVLEYVHRMQDRAAFAAGSIEALRRLVRKGPGRYEWSELLCGD
jgi:4-hydroxy-tetrahydrodipicolinate reductase